MGNTSNSMADSCQCMTKPPPPKKLVPGDRRINICFSQNPGFPKPLIASILPEVLLSTALGSLSPTNARGSERTWDLEPEGPLRHGPLTEHPHHDSA